MAFIHPVSETENESFPGGIHGISERIVQTSSYGLIHEI